MGAGPANRLAAARRPLSLVVDRDRGVPHDTPPPTPPGIRVTYHGGSDGVKRSKSRLIGEARPTRVEVGIGQRLLDGHGCR